MKKRISVVLTSLLVAGCARTTFHDSKGDCLPGLPFLWVDADGKKHLAYVQSTTGFGTASFEVQADGLGGGYTKVSTNLDSTAAAELTGGLLDKAFLEFDGETFDVVLDLSTIDHVQPKETPVVLFEYHRVLRPGGLLFLVAWCSLDMAEVRFGDSGKYDHNAQYYLDLDRTRDLLYSLFERINEEHIEVCHPRYLVGMLVRKPLGVGGDRCHGST